MNVEDLTPNEKIEYITKNIPEDFHNVFADAFSEFVDTCYQDSVKFHENEEDFEKYFDIFMKFPHAS